MRILCFLLALLANPALGPAFDSAFAGELLDTLQRDRAELDRLTGGEETLNRVKLLHLGKNSQPARLELIKNVQSTLFISVPYWYNDVSGKATYEALKRKVHASSGLDVRILTDWTSPGSTGDIFGVGMILKLYKLTDKNTLLWNAPWWGRRFSKKLIQNRLHDKMIIADGEKLLMGGLNIGDSYLEGGLTSKGWHDTDVLIEGPAAADAARIFIKTWELGRYLKSHDYFPSFAREGWSFLRDYFYRGKEALEYLKPTLFGKKEREVRIPYKEQIRYLGLEPSQVAQVSEGVPVRLVYDNPLFNHVPKNGKAPYCNFHCVLERLFASTQKSIRIFAPYLTISEEFRALLARQARRGIKVEIITNSIKSHDIGGIAYYAALQNYLPLLEAGVVIHEWQGHRDLLDLEKRYDCSIPLGSWPGRTLHTKALILDGEVGIIGSHNMNIRSEMLNTEVMAIISDPGFASQLNDVFEYDLDRAGPRTVTCGKRTLNRNRRVQTRTLPEMREFIKHKRGRIGVLKHLDSLI
jgi:cardiolipin synthase C